MASDRLTPAVLLAGLIIGTAYGPLSMLADISPEQVADVGYWAEVAAATIRSFAASALAIGAIIAAAIGVPLVRPGQARTPEGPDAGRR